MNDLIILISHLDFQKSFLSGWFRHYIRMSTSLSSQSIRYLFLQKIIMSHYVGIPTSDKYKLQVKSIKECNVSRWRNVQVLNVQTPSSLIPPSVTGSHNASASCQMIVHSVILTTPFERTDSFTPLFSAAYSK